MAFEVRDVLCVWDRYTTPEKPKWHICICPDARLFLRINSRAYWPPYHVLYAEDCAFLDHDSYVELQQLWHHSQSDVRRAKRIGRLSVDEASELCVSVAAAVTFNDEQKDFIREQLLSTI